ncbi:MULTISPECIES: acyl-CoA dehydrogenase family protein [Gordonia]|uniref:Acyl-CoA dehydrogenase family protein n=1 Tax=Gordonia amicalis TaxID=89053 RepID=A0ABU4DDW6_9ACTN|nr:MULTISPECIES: acyl-CoA dehydrogenase family protein [Gordonia]ATD72287.1 acyl-CoA dehydrogenase [Gordonia sp. 1D]MCZ4651539.1 acyl-CoA/acyl-ACP dehydrogenase [Gordonia amicalis]MDJ0452572.1 acyl-CoA dehydrogenase family protein [Gordonia amicalis]MDV6307855.1 acyl-CoA dehydrogenase family protein [Gordonia amicalis]MDV7075130.1 acyl-CoA dehydrogenase family protein [Gordonia amicalis]
MDFELTDEQRAIRDSTRSLLQSHPGAARAVADSPSGFDAGLWRQGTELGWSALAAPEDVGGLGQGVVDLALVAVEHGRFVTASPFMPTVAVLDALLRAGDDHAALIDALVSGESSAAWAFTEPHRSPTVDALQTTAVAADSGYRITGEKVTVADASTADVLLVDAVLEGNPARFLVPRDASGVKIRRIESLDITRELDDITLDAVHVGQEALLGSPDTARAAIERTLRLMTVLACAELVGVGEYLLETSVDYAKAREQFGVPIGSFQAVKHKCADMRMWVQASRAATLHAAMSLDADEAGSSLETARAVSVAKAFVSDSICKTAGEALQVHGGIGFTWEHDLHLYIRRARANAALYGDADHHHEALCALLEAR